MRSFELKPTYENIYKTFIEDKIGRNMDLFYFINILNSIEGNCSIALDSCWGSGKTFFIKQAKMIFDVYNDHIVNDYIKDKDNVKATWDRINRKNLTLTPHVTVYYDAWENDNDNDPILSLVYQIIKSFDGKYSFNESFNINDIANLGFGVIELFTGRNLTNVYDKVKALKGNDFLKEIRAEKGLHTKVEDFLAALLPEQGDRLVIFIDELDRCKPSYAIKLLERIKHYFTNDNITFVFSINMEELLHIVKQHYGSGFNASRYLDRFFDLRMSLPKADTNKFYKSINFNINDSDANIICDYVIRYFNFGLREISRFINIYKIATDKFTKNKDKLMEIYGNQLRIISFLSPFLLGLKMSNNTIYNELINGNNYEPMKEFYLNKTFDPYMLSYYLIKPSDLNDNNIDFNLIEENLKKLYDNLFIKSTNDDMQYVCIGRLIVTNDTMEILLKIISLISEHADITGLQ